MHAHTLSGDVLGLPVLTRSDPSSVPIAVPALKSSRADAFAPPEATEPLMPDAPWSFDVTLDPAVQEATMEIAADSADEPFSADGTSFVDDLAEDIAPDTPTTISFGFAGDR